MKNYEFWFVVGSQTLYGEEVLRTVAARAEEMAQKLSAVLPYPLKYKVTAKSNAEILDVVKEANYNDACAGIVTWCHTFSPSKMWINGLELLQKPWCHFATQYNRDQKDYQTAAQTFIQYYNVYPIYRFIQKQRVECFCRIFSYSFPYRT